MAEIVATASSALAERLRQNDPLLVQLILNRVPSTYFTDVGAFCDALKQNTTVTSVKLTSQFLLNLPSDHQRMVLLQTIGGLPALKELALGAVRPASILAEALQKATANNNLTRLTFWKLRLASHQDVLDLSHALAQCKSLQSIRFSGIQYMVKGQNRINAQGKIWFQETDASKEELSLDPLLDAMSSLPQLQEVSIQHPFNGSRIEPPSEGSLRGLCRSTQKCLIFQECGLSEQQCLVIADELKKKKSNSLSFLGVQTYQITSQAWDAFVDMLAANYTITDFVHGTEAEVTRKGAPSVQQLDKIGYYLRLNKHGRRHLFCGHDDGARRAAWFDFLVRAHDNLDLVFFAMQADPSLCSADW